MGTVLPVRREPTMTGTIVSIPTPGSVTLVDVWSTTCAPCLATMPEIEAMWRAHKGAGLRVIGVAVDDNPGLVDKKVRELGITYPIVMDPSGILRGALRVTELPGAFVVDRTGKVRVFREGGDGSDRRALRDAVEALLAEEKK
ncbi:MAG: TlpA disulfide reductase family protein [Myxococcales bacterium]